VGGTDLGPSQFKVFNAKGNAANRIFDIGGRIEVKDIPVDEKDLIRLSTPDRVLFTGRAGKP
jgi:hypothetical protein